LVGGTGVPKLNLMVRADIISKGDGFIWIKRKHYFDPRLNPRFFARRNLSMQEDR
jgi:hypothetical protein